MTRLPRRLLSCTELLGHNGKLPFTHTLRVARGLALKMQGTLGGTHLASQLSDLRLTLSQLLK